MSMQVNIRLDETFVEEIDGWAVLRGLSRPELIRKALAEWMGLQESERIAEQYAQAYAAHPETEDELGVADENARLLVAEEPWQQWW